MGLVAVGVMLALLVGVVGLGVYLLASQGSGQENASLVTATTTPSESPAAATPAATAAPSATPRAAPSPNRVPPAVKPPKLTASLSGQYCPVASVGQNSCWKGSVVNTGPRIGRLAMTFVIGGGYTNWFATHSGPALSGFYTTPGCVLDVPHARMLCGSVPSDGKVSVYLSADASKAGTFHYAVKFADISYSSPDYIDTNPDGTHRVVSWSESIS